MAPAEFTSSDTVEQKKKIPPINSDITNSKTQDRFLYNQKTDRFECNLKFIYSSCVTLTYL